MILIDADVVIDIVLDRAPRASAAVELMDRIELGIERAAVAATDTSSIRFAISLSMSDFEDAMQVSAARACGATHIVTRNLVDYQRSPVPATSPQDYLNALA